MQEAVPRTVETYLTRDGRDAFQAWLDGLADRRARVLVDKTVAKSAWATRDIINLLGKAYRRSSWDVLSAMGCRIRLEPAKKAKRKAA